MAADGDKPAPLRGRDALKAASQLDSGGAHTNGQHLQVAVTRAPVVAPPFRAHPRKAVFRRSLQQTGTVITRPQPPWPSAEIAPTAETPMPDSTHTHVRERCVSGQYDTMCHRRD